MVVAEDLRKVFTDGRKQVVAVDQASFRAEPGQALGVLGVNGAGKTTILRVLSTVLQPTSGSASVAGFDVATSPRQVRRNIGFLSATTAIYGRLTAREMIAFFAGLNGFDGDELRRRVDAVVARFDIAGFADRLCDKLSTGQKQRVSIARTVVHDPPVLFFDEPTNGLDVLTSQSLMEFIEEACSQGKTVLYSTHAMHEAQRLCKRAVVIHKGRVLANDEIGGILEQTGAPDLERAFLALVNQQGSYSSL